jgi:aspartate aminotransferase
MMGCTSMNDRPEQRRSAKIGASLAGMTWFMTESTWAKRRGMPGVMDLALGNPQEMPIPGYVEALQRWVEPCTSDWFEYKLSERDAREVSAASLRQRTGVPFLPDDVAMTTGAFGALAVALKALTLPGDEVIFNLPPWMCYELLILDAGAEPVKVSVEPYGFDLDLDAIAAAITSKTRIVIVNSPHNPTGRIYPRETLAALARLLEEASRANGRRIYLLSDEAYARIVFDGHRAVSPSEIYSHTLVAYTWGKQLLTPGQRIGYLALAPGMPEGERRELRQDIFLTQVATGFAFPNALLQHALGDLDQLSIDMRHYQRKRDRMLAGLRDIGYELHEPEGTFYLLAKSPIPDDRRFAGLLAERDVFVLPGEFCEYPGYFRISLTASDDMLDRSLPHFQDVLRSIETGERLVAD